MVTARLLKILLTAVMALPAILAGCYYGGTESEMTNPAAVPLIDTQVPAAVEMATFALG